MKTSGEHFEKKSAENFLITDPIFKDLLHFKNRQLAYGKAGRTFANLIEKAERLRFDEEEKEIFEQLFIIMSVVDSMVDDLKLEKSEVARIISNGDPRTPSLNNALSGLHKLIDVHGDYEAFIANSLRAMSYSEKGTIVDRHREALYLGKAIAVAVRKEGEARAHLIKVLGHLTSLGNFADDIMDHRQDKKSVSWVLGRAGAGTREALKLYGTSDAAHKYLAGAAWTALTIYGRRAIPKIFRNNR